MKLIIKINNKNNWLYEKKWYIVVPGFVKFICYNYLEVVESNILDNENVKDSPVFFLDWKKEELMKVLDKVTKIGKAYIIWTWNIWDKARELLIKAQKLNEIGFETPKRVMITENFINLFLLVNDLGENLSKVEITEDLESKIMKSFFTEEQYTILNDIINSYQGEVLAIRSSAEWDSRWTGVYTSEFVEKDMNLVELAFKKVLCSYFTINAVEFRKKAKLKEGFGIIIEPMIYEKYLKHIAPVMSGFWYTSTAQWPWYINAVPGLWGWVDTRYGEKITAESIWEYDGNLVNYLLTELVLMKSVGDNKKHRVSSLLRTDQRVIHYDKYIGSAYELYTGNIKGWITKKELTFAWPVKNNFEWLNLTDFFDKIKKMEKEFGKPQYFEWALTFRYGEPVYWITQIADTSPNLDVLDFQNLPDILAEWHSVVGTRKFIAEDIVICMEEEDMEKLFEYNKTHKNYILFYSSNLVSKWWPDCMRFAHFSNATMLAEIETRAHSGSPIGHFWWKLEATSKVFCILDEEKSPLLDSLIWEQSMDFQVYNKKFEITSSERQNRLVICELD